MLQNPSATTSSSSSSSAAGLQQQQQQQQQQHQMPQPKLVVIRRRPNQGFGFTLRHFIAYPPEDDPSWPQEASEPYQVKAMETIFIKEVHPNGPAYYANLQTGDRVLMVNNTPIAGIAYSTIVSMIKQTPSELKLLVVPKECDVLQMHYTSIAHTPQSNVMASAAATTCPPKSIPSPIVTTGNGKAASSTTTSAASLHSNNISSNSSGALLPMSVAMAGKPFPLHHHQQHQHQLISFPAAAQLSSRSGSISSTNSLRPLTSSDFMELSSSQTMSSASYTGNMLQHSDSGGFLRSPPPAVLTRQQQLQHQQLQQQHQQQQHQQNSVGATTLYASNAAVDTSDLMIRLRESIKQKEEFLKSPLPNVHQYQQQQYTSQHQQPQHFFPHTPPSGSPQLSMVSTSSTSVGVPSSAGCVGGGIGYIAGNATTARGQVRALVKQPLSATSSSSSTRELLTATTTCDMHYAPNLGSSSTGGGIGGSGGGVGGTYGSTARSQQHQHQQQQQQQHQQKLTTSSNINARSGSNLTLRDKYQKDYEFMETLQETGVTNKVFESKLVSHLARGFDPFKPLSINTNAIEQSTAAAAAAAAASTTSAIMKKQSVLYDSLQHHPLHQMQVQQQQHPQHSHVYQQHGTTMAMAPKMTVSNVASISAAGAAATTAASSSLAHHNNTAQQLASTSAVDGQRFSRMEIHKASLAATTIDHQSNNSIIHHSSSGKYASKLADVNERKPTLTDIAESDTITAAAATVSTRAALASATAATSSATVVPPSTINTANVVRRFRPMSSFDETKPMRRISYLRATNDDYHCDTSAASLANSSAASSIAPETLSTKSTTTLSQQIDEHPDPIYDVVGGGSGGADSTSESLDALEDLRLDASCSSRRTSINSDLRHSVHIDSIPSIDVNGKLETKDVSTDMEIFETEMEIKSSSIHGKRQSEYRSWRQVKIEIKGDILKIYPSRNTKSDSNVVELDIRNFKIIEEPDKKKHVFRMQSKRSPIASLGNELNIDDTNDKLTSSTGSSSSAQQQSLVTTTTQQQNHSHTDILFKTKSGTEMRNIFGLLQWKNSLIYDNDNDLQGKQLAEPQKTAATASMSTITNYCDDNVQHHLHAEHSPLSSTSRSELEAADSISPVMKTRKSSSHKNLPDKDLGSPKAKNWKDLLFRRGGGSSNSSQSADFSPCSLSSSSKLIGSIGVPLKTCPMSKNNEYVPTLVEVCTNIVETKGLGVVGIYRIPGNKAAISELSDQVNKIDFSWERCNTDVRWEDVNVVSSLLKLFIRSLPDALMPTDSYNLFIEADKLLGLERLTVLKQLIGALPRYSYETIKHLFRHLQRVSQNCDVNLMEPKNLAIIFGPSIIRTPNDTLDIAVKDMKHQCRIVELLLTHYEYFFEHGDIPDIEDVCGNNLAASTSSSATGVSSQQQQQQEEQTNMLLHNISKIERFTERESSSSSNTTTTRTSRFIPHLRKRATNKRPETAAHSGDSALSLDYTKSVSGTPASSSSSSSTTTSSTKTKKKEQGFLSGRTRGHGRKASLDEKDSGSASCSSIIKEPQRKSVDISITLTDDESSNSRLSDTGSMSLGVITDTLDSKLSKLRSGSESNDENGSPDFPIQRRYTLGEPLILHTENIPYADESPERHFINFCPLDNITGANNLMLSRSCTSTNTLMGAKTTSSEKEKPSSQLTTTYKTTHKLQHSATAPINSSIGSVVGGGGISSSPTASSTPTTVGALKGGLTASTARNIYATSKNLRFSASVHEQRCSEDDSEGSTTSDPKEALVMASPSFPLDKFNKKRRDHRLYRSASFNCRNYSSRYGGVGSAGGGGGNMPALTKDEKTDMNLTKKRQIQNNKQNRSIKRRHTVGGPHDYNSTNGGAPPPPPTNNCNHHCKNNSASSNNSSGGGGGLRRMPLTSANGNISHNNNNNMQHEEGSGSGSGSGGGGGGTSSNGNNSSSSNSSNTTNTTNNATSATAATVNVANSSGEHVLEVGIRIKNINRARF